MFLLRCIDRGVKSESNLYTAAIKWTYFFCAQSKVAKLSVVILEAKKLDSNNRLTNWNGRKEL